ncbi:hypothetical protein E6R60_26425 [Streptomyces sp. A0642]|uniref:hypothetical protein n=1 Tax=Streptomyces sp. A0642 TaxID=2563100 RepID=UPI0010A28634|nr:hypothetical protein [Streptomyces sp. A0642]THA72469.1 hypothetical protein E6R60_26425 [Streptomyces sp. A0642]
MTSPTEDRSPLATFDPASIHQLYLGLDVPDPITFVVSPQYLNRPNLYPRQATLLKCFFLREDLFTDYDYQVVAEWDEQYRTAKNTNEQRAAARALLEQDATFSALELATELEQNEDAPKMPIGGTPDLLGRMRAAKAAGYQWFREILLVMGRRAGKGHISGLAMAYVLWTYMAKSDPQEFYGVDRDKKLACLIFAGKRDQAKQNLWRDLVNVVTGSPCFAPYIASSLGERLTVYAPHDFIRMDEMAKRGIKTALDMATFEILPKESTLMAGRGPASFIMGFDEMAHVVASGANRSAGEVYDSATPSLDQFGKDGFLIEPSSPWAMTGKFFENYERAVELEPDGTPAYPAIMMIQLASWDIYLDWQIADTLPLFPENFTGDNGEYDDTPPPTFKPLRNAIQTYDDQMRKLEKADPDTFAVERRAQWATVMDAYLDKDKVEAVFSPWYDRPAHYGGQIILPTTQGILAYGYKGHADPSSVNCRFGIAVAHTETDAQGRPHVIFDKIHHFDPADFPNHTIDYEEVEDWIWDEIIAPYQPEEFTFDQYQSVGSIQKLVKKVARNRLPKKVSVFERTATNALNWKYAETFKAAINMGLVHAPDYPEGKLELQFLQKPPNQNRVDHPTIGPVQTKDIADAIMITTWSLIGDWITGYIDQLKQAGPIGAMQGGMHGFSPRSNDTAQPDYDSQARIDALRSFTRTRTGRDTWDRGPGRGRPGYGRR